MTIATPPPFVLALTGTSESTGRLSAFPVGLRPQLSRDLPVQPEAVGQVIVLDKGHGGWTSNDILLEAPDIAALRPNHILAEAGDINDCVDFGGGPAITRAQKVLNMQAAVAIWRGAIPGVDITFQTMNPVSAVGAAVRPTLSDYYADTMVQAASLGLDSIDNYAAWPKPLPEWMSNAFDGLHPVWANAVEVYAYRAILFKLRQKMAAWWGLSAPVAPVYPTAPDVRGLLIAGGGAGGDQVGGGGGAGGIVRVLDYLPAFLGAFGIGAAGVHSAGNQGGDGGDTFIGSYRAIKGGGGGYHTASPASNWGRDGGSSGGGGGSTGARTAAPGVGRNGQGFYGGKSDQTDRNGGGGGGGCCTPGADAAVNGGVGGTGWTVDVPGVVQDVCGGGPGGSFNGSRPAYGLGGGPTKFGGGGRGGGDILLGFSAGDDGGIGKGWIWYPGAPRCGGGVITSSGGFTVHDLTGTGTLA